MNDDTVMPKAPLKRKPVQADNIIAVASGKGGVGKTWFSITLAHALSKAGKNVLLFDGDLGLANIDVQLGLTPERDLALFIENKMPLKRLISTCEEIGVDVLAGQSGTASLSSLPVEKVIRIRDALIELADEYDYIVIDLGAGVDRTVRILSSAASQALILTNEEPTALTDAYAYIKLTHLAGLSNTVRVVVNQITSKSMGDRIYNTLVKACQNFLKFRPPLAGMIRHDTKVSESIRNQKPLLTRHPNAPAAVDVETIAKSLTGPHTPTE